MNLRAVVWLHAEGLDVLPVVLDFVLCLVILNARQVRLQFARVFLICQFGSQVWVREGIEMALFEVNNRFFERWLLRK